MKQHLKEKTGNRPAQRREGMTWKLTIKGSIIIPSNTFQEADELFAKAMKAISEVWDIDVQGTEVIKHG